MDGLIRNREALGISLADVSRWSGVALQTIRRHEAGEAIATPSTREALHRTYAAIEALRNAVPKGEELARRQGLGEHLAELADKPAPASVEELEEEEAIDERNPFVESSHRREAYREAAAAGRAIAARLNVPLEEVRASVAGGTELDDAIESACLTWKLDQRARVALHRDTMDLRHKELAELEDRVGASSGTRLRAGEECACLLYDQIGKAKSRTLLGAARVVVIEANDNEAMVRVIKTSSELAPRFLKKEMRLTRAELFSDRSKEERNAFRKLVSKYWGPDVNRGESATATHAKKAKRGAK